MPLSNVLVLQRQFIKVITSNSKAIPWIVLILFLLLSFRSKSNHLMGGDISYEFLNINGNQARYLLKAVFYRDCNGGPNAAQLSQTYSFGIYNGQTNALISVANLPQRSIAFLTNFAPNCPYPPGICVQEGIYTDTISVPINLPNNPGFWVSLYTRVRNTSIQNVSTANFPTNFDGMIWSCYIPPANFQNSSPSFLAKPVPYMCNGREFRFNHVGFDPNGDSLVFRLAWPYSGPGVNFQNGNLVAGVPGGFPNQTPPPGTVPYPPLQGCNPNTSQWFGASNYLFPYSFPSRQLPTNPVFDGITIDPNTGEVILSPSANGNFVVAVEVQEFRTDRLNDTAYYLGSVRRDLQFIIGSSVNCFTNQPPIITTPADSFNINVNQTLNFTISATDPNIGDSVSIDKSGVIFDASAGLTPPFAILNPSKGLQSATTNFSWTPDCSKARVAPYSFVITAFDNNCNVSSKTIFIKVNPRPIINPQPIQCIQQLADDTLRIQWIQNNSASFGKYLIYRSLNNGAFVLYDSIATNTVNNYTDVNAINASTTIYKYRIAIANNCGEVGNLSAEIENIRVQHNYINPGAISLFWNKARKTVSNATYQIGRDNGDGQLFFQAGTTDTNGVVGACNGTIQYTVFEEVLGAACLSSGFSAKLLLIDTIKPNNPVLAFATVESGQIRVRFRTSISPDAITHSVNRAVGSNPFSQITNLTGLATPDSVTFTDVSSNPSSGTYQYQIRASDSCGNFSNFSDIHQAVWLQANNNGHLRSNLLWTRYVGFSVANYAVERLNGILWNTLAILPPTDTTFIDTINQSCGDQIQYRIVAIQNSANQQPYSSVSNIVTTTPIDTIRPEAPVILGATILNNNTISIQFMQPLATDVDRYDLFVSINGGNFNTVGSISAQGNLEFVHSGLNTRNNRYCYIIRAVDTCDAGGFSEFSEPHCPVRLQGSPSQLSNNLFWKPYFSSTIQRHLIQIQQGVNWITIDSILASDTSYIHQPLACNRAISYRIITELIGGYQSFSSTIQLTPFDTIAPNAPLLTNASVLSNGQIAVFIEPSNSTDVNTHTSLLNGVNNGTFSRTKRLLSTADTVIFTGLNTTNQAFCATTIANDSCSSLTTTSNIVCTAWLSAIAGNLQVNLQWQLFSGWPIDYQLIQRFDFANNLWITLDSVNESVTSFTDSVGIICNQVNNYRIVTNHAKGLSLSNESAAIPFDNIAPISPIINHVSVLNQTEIFISWQPSQSQDVNKYRIIGGISGQPLQLIDSVDGSNNSFVHSVANTSSSVYCYQIIAVDSCGGNLSIPSLPHCTFLLEAVRIGCEKAINISWQTYPFWGSDIAGYRIYGGQNNNPNTLLGSVNSQTNSFLVQNLILGSDFCFRVEAFHQNGLDTSFSASYCMPIDFPAAPTMEVVTVNASSNTNGSNLITWRKIPQSEKPQSQSLFASTGNGSFSLLQANIPPADTSFLHGNINTIDSFYRYYLVYEDSCGNPSLPSQTHNSIELSLAGGQIIHTLNWNAYAADSVLRYEIYTFNTPSPVFFDSVSGSQTNYSVYPAPCNFDVYYIVKAILANGAASWSDSAVIRAIDTIPALKPDLYQATVVDNDFIDLSFTGSASTDLFGYAIYRSTDGGPFVSINLLLNAISLANLQYRDTLNTLQGYHCYTILVLDSCLNATPSDTFCVMQLGGLAENLQNTIYWRPFVGYPLQNQEVEVFENGNWITLATLPPLDTVFVHNQLPCNVPFSYRIKAFSSSGNFITFSDTIVLTPFDTIPPEPPLLLLANVINNTTVGLKWLGSTSGDVGNYRIWILPQGGVPRFFNTIGIIDSVSISNLVLSDSSYSFAVMAIDTCAENLSLLSNSQTIVRLQGRAGNLLNTLNWNAYQQFANQIQFVQLFVNGAWANIDTLPNSALNFTHNNLFCNQNYSYRIQTFDTITGQISNSNTIQLSPFDSIPPVSPIIWRATVQPNQTTLIDFKPSISTDILYYKIEASINGSVFDSIGIIPSNADTIYSFNHISATANLNNYCYRVVAVDTCQLLPSQPSNVHCPASLQALPGNLQVALSWSSYSGFNVSKYIIERAIIGNAFAPIDSVLGSQTFFIDASNLVCNTNYSYRLRVIELGGNNQIAFSDTAQAIPFNILPPIAPRIWSVSVENDNNISIKWSKSITPSVNKYEIWRSDAINAATFVANVFNDTSYLDTVIGAYSNRYSYYVIAFDSCTIGNASAPSANATSMNVFVRTGTCIPANVVFWNSFPYYLGGVQQYILERSIDGGGFSQIAIISPSDTNFVDTGLILTSAYCYRIKAVGFQLPELSKSGETCASPELFPSPKNVILTRATVIQTGITNGAVQLNWLTANPQDTLNRGYQIYHSTSGLPGSFLLLASIADLNRSQFNHNNINTSTSDNYYRVQLFDSCGNVSDSTNIYKVINLSATNGNLNTQLSWTRFEGYSLREYQVERSSNGALFIPIVSVPATDTFYNDTTVACGNLYSYRIVGLPQDTTLLETFSDTITTLSFDTIAPPVAIPLRAHVVFTSTTAGLVSINWQQDFDPNLIGFEIEKRVNGGPPTIITIPGSLAGVYQFSDGVLNTLQNSHSYRIRGFDSCGNIAAFSVPIEPIQLQVNAQSAVNQLNWSPYNGPNNGLYYINRKTSGSPWITLDSIPLNFNSYQDSLIQCDTTYFYQVFTGIPPTIGLLPAGSDTAAVIAFDNQPPVTPNLNNVSVVTTAQRGVVNLSWQNSISADVANYRVYHRTSTTNWQLIGNTQTNTTFTHASVNTLSEVNFYQIEAVDSCRNTAFATSPTHATILLTATPGNEQAILNFTAYQGWPVLNYLVYRDGVLVATLPPNQFIFTDVQLLCTQTYVYTIEAIGIAGQGPSLSNSVAIQPFDNTPPLTPSILLATTNAPLNDSVVSISWIPSTSFDARTHLVRFLNPLSGQVQVLKEASPGFALDTVLVWNAPRCYTVEVQDICGNISQPSQNICVIWLEGQTEPTGNRLNFTPYVGFGSNLAGYRVYQVFNNGQIEELASLSASTTSWLHFEPSLDEATFCYFIEAFSVSGGLVSRSNKICLTPGVRFEMPNAFSPYTSSGLNDFFGPVGSFISEMELIIWDRWGNMVFKSNQKDKLWNGKTGNGAELMQGLYVYEVTITDNLGRKETRKGTVTLLK